MAKKTTEKFIEEAKAIHGDRFDYSKTVYNGCKEKVTIICPIHGEFYPSAVHFLYGSECPKCIAERFSLGTEEFIRRAKEIHKDTYNYDKVKYINSNTKVIITCPKHGDFETFPLNHLKGCNCPKCANENKIPSKGEIMVENLLIEKNIQFKKQVSITVKDLARNSHNIILDFAFKYNNQIYILEYNGKQHYEYIPFFFNTGEDFQKQLRRDESLRKYCIKNNINLIEIKYNNSKETIEQILDNIINLQIIK